jgi:anthranilate synthase/aminodeoxychorismate synthase-like glutamine amidotransferase
MILLIDNYDSFAHNLGRYFELLGQQTMTVRNDAIDVAAVHDLRPAAIVLSPGPCTPREAGASLDIVSKLHTEFPILGVCLGHQVIAAALGGRIARARTPMHGQTSAVTHDGTGLFADVPSPLDVARYHSLVAEPESLPSCLHVTAKTDDGVIMAFAHADHPVYGVQFHPESILTQHGYKMLANFLRLAGIDVRQDPRSLERAELRGRPIAERPVPAGPVTF